MIRAYIVIITLMISTTSFADIDGIGNNCKNGICEIFRVTDSYSKDVIRSENVAGSNGGVIIVDTEPKVATVSCWKAARVPKPVYDSIIAMMKSLRGSNGRVPTTFTPAQQTMLLFYNTIMQQTLNYSCKDSLIRN